MLGLPLGRLNLSDAQRQQIRSIQQQRAPELRALAAKVATAMDAQRRASVAVPLDEQAIRAAARDVATAQADLSVERARVYNEVFGVLTPEQQDRARSLRAQAEARMKERRERAAQRQPRRQI
jgi:Spy/CpxP family protein refolding chaperone